MANPPPGLIDVVSGIFNPFIAVFGYIGELLSIFIQILIFAITLIPSLITFALFFLTHIFQILIMAEIVIFAFSIKQLSFSKSLEVFKTGNLFLVKTLMITGQFLIERSIQLYQLVRG